jgi:hypothetical protein
MRRFTVIFMLCTAVALPSCSRMDVKRDFDPAVDFASMKTYGWLTEKDILESSDPKILEEQRFVRDCVHRAVDLEMAEKGMRLAPGSPDFLVTYTTASRDKMQLQGSKEKGWTFTDRLLYPGWIEGNTEIYYDIGTLILDMVNPRNKQLIWRGSVEADLLKDISRDQLEKRIDQAVKKLLKPFPPDRKP